MVKTKKENGNSQKAILETCFDLNNKTPTIGKDSKPENSPDGKETHVKVSIKPMTGI